MLFTKGKIAFPLISYLSMLTSDGSLALWKSIGHLCSRGVETYEIRGNDVKLGPEQYAVHPHITDTTTDDIRECSWLVPVIFSPEARQERITYDVCFGIIFYLLFKARGPSISNKIILGYSISRSGFDHQAVHSVLFNGVSKDFSFVGFTDNDAKLIIVRDIIIGDALKKEPSYLHEDTAVNSTADNIAITFYPTGKPSIVLTCEVARTFAEKTTGLMYRSSLPMKNGMLFLFSFPWLRIFWMKNVSIPLDIIFINATFNVASIHETSAHLGIFNKRFWACGFGKYVIECNSGFCKSHQISSGTRITIQDINWDTKKRS